MGKPEHARARRAARLLLSIFGLALLFGPRFLLPARVSQTPGHADVTFSIRPHGAASIQLGFRQRPRKEMILVGRSVVEAAFPGLTSRVDYRANGLGRPFVETRSDDVYVPGPHPIVEIETQKVAAALGSSGFRNWSFTVCPAFVDSTISPPGRVTDGDCKFPDSNTAVVTVEMRPRPDRLWRGVAITGVQLASILIALIFLKRRPAIAITGAALGIAFPLLAVFWSPSNDEISVAGRSMPFAAAMNGIVSHLAIAGGVVVLYAVFTVRSRRVLTDSDEPRRCANGHPLSLNARYCPLCGATVEA